MAGNTATLQIKIDVDNKGTVTLDQVSKSLNNVDIAARKASEGLKTLEAPAAAAGNIGKITAGVDGAKKSVNELAQAWAKQRQENSAAALTEQAFGQAAQLAQTRAKGAAAAEAARAQQARQAAEAARQAEAAAAAAAKTQASYGQLGLRSVQQIRTELAANKAAYDQIRTSGTASAQDISRAYTALAAKNKELNAELKQTQQATGGLSDMIGGKLLPAIAGIVTLGTAGKVIGMADEMSVLSSKVGLATGSMEEQRAVQQQLYAMSQATRSEIGVNANAFFGFSSALKSTGASSKDVLGVLDMVNKSLKISGATAGEASSFTLQFKQALGSGVLQGDEFRSMMENNVVFARALAEAMGTDVTGLRAMSSAGELTTRKLATLFPEMAANISAAFDKIPVTVEGAVTQIENAFKMALAGANETTGGTNKLATQISGLAVIVQENAPAIGALFTGVTLGAQGFVRLGSFVVGTFETIAAAALAASGVIFKVGEGVGWLTDQIGITEQAAQRWRAESDAAFGAAGGLAGQAADNYNRMTRSTAEAEKAQKDWLKSLQGGSAAVLADIDAQKKREAEHAGSVQSMSKAEKKAADERAKVLDEMHKAIGGEEYYRREADKVLAHVEVLKKAGATQEQQAQYTYEKIADLSAQAWKKGETAAGEYLDQLKSTYADAAGVVASTDLSVDITADSSQLQAVAAQSKQELDALGNTTATAGIAADAGQFSAAADSSRQQAAELAATVATVKVDADVSSFSTGVAEVESQINRVKSLLAEGMGGAGGQVALSPQAIASSSVLLDPFGRMRAIVEAIERGETTLSFMGETINLSSYTQQGSYAGGGYTWDGPRSGGMDGIGGRQVLLHPQETVIDHLQPDRAAIVSLYDQFVGSQQRGIAAAPSSSSAASSAAGGAPINIGTLIIQQATDVDGLMREIRRRAVR